MGFSYRRIYDTKIKKVLIGAGISIPLIFGIFWYLVLLGDITVIGYSGDMTCAGTINDPCYAYINFTSNKDVYIYPTNETTWTFNTSVQMKEMVMQRSWGNSWRTIYLNQTWSKNVKYAIKFSSGQNYSLRFIGYKNNPNDNVKWGFADIDPYWYGIKSNSHTFADGSIGCENASFEINNTDKSLVLKNNYKSFVSNRMTPFIILKNGNKHYIKDLLPDYKDRLNFSIKRISCNQWKLSLDLSIPENVNVDYFGFSYENIIGSSNIEIDREEKILHIGMGGAEFIIDWRGFADRLSLNRTSKEVLIDISGIKEISIDSDPIITLVPGAQYPTTSGALTENTHTISTQTAITATCYDQIAGSNNIYCLENEGTTALDPYFIINFSAPYSLINWMNITAELKNTAGADALHLALWNFTSGAFQDVVITANPGAGIERTLYYYIAPANISSFKDSNGLIRVMPHTAGGSADDMNLDFVSLKVSYNATDGGDPTITFSTASITDISVTPLTNQSFVIAYYDDTNDDVSFQIYDTNGTQIVVETDAYTSGSSCLYDCVDVASFNSSYFIIVWGVDSTLDQQFAIYNSTGSNVTAIGKIDTYNGFGISVTTFNATHWAVVWNDQSNTYLEQAVYNWATKVTGPATITNFGGSVGQATSEISAFNSTHYVISWYNYTSPYHCAFAIYKTSSTTAVVAKTVMDSACDYSHGSSNALSTFNSTHFVAGYRNGASETFEIRDIAGTLIYINAYDADASTGSASNSVFNSTHFVVGWYDSTDVDYSFEVFDINNNTVTAMTDVETLTTGTKKMNIASRLTAVNISFCDDSNYFIYAYANTTTQAIWTSYQPNGTAWDGTCPTEPPVGDTCDYSSGDWNIDCTENCIVDTAADVGNNDIIFTGSGTISIEADISNFDDLIVQSGCDLVINGGRLFAG